MRHLLILSLPLLTLGCINEVRVGNPACDTRDDCKPEVIGSEFKGYNCVANQCVASLCGNGDLDQDALPGSVEWEECDDGDDDDTNACTNSCRLPSCGDGVLHESAGEQCDDPEGNDDTVADKCRTDCKLPRCGDGVADTGEVCDDGNDLDNDACLTGCAAEAACGDGIVHVGVEECDDGERNGQAACQADCTLDRCGDGERQGADGSGAQCLTIDDCPDPRETCIILDPEQPGTCEGWGEECDEGEANSDDEANACRTSCRAAYCGDGVQDEGESCDDGNLVSGDGCTDTCEQEETICGDMIVQHPEECDDGNQDDQDECRNSCMAATCGDGIRRLDVLAGVAGHEECDDGNEVDEDGCRTNCVAAICGDSIVRTDVAEGEEGFESCDDGNEFDDDACPTTCVIAHCGDGLVRSDIPAGQEGHEECDDGNEVDGDECRNTCQGARCGDGVTWIDVEQCDDGNEIFEDSCLNCQNASCGDGVHREDLGGGTGRACGAGQGPCPGNEVCLWGFCRPEGYEYCDDGNDLDDDGCTPACVPMPCGDGEIHTGQTCDDGNRTNLDGCDALCQSEPFPYCVEEYDLVVMREGEYEIVALDARNDRAIVGFEDGLVAVLDLSQPGSVMSTVFTDSPVVDVGIRPGDEITHYASFHEDQALIYSGNDMQVTEDGYYYLPDNRQLTMGSWSFDGAWVMQVTGNTAPEEMGQCEDDGGTPCREDADCGEDVLCMGYIAPVNNEPGIFTVRMENDQPAYPESTSLREDANSPLPTLLAVSRRGYYLRYNLGEDPEILRVYTDLHEPMADSDIVGARVAAGSGAEVVAIARPNGNTGMHWLIPPQEGGGEGGGGGGPGGGPGGGGQPGGGEPGGGEPGGGEPGGGEPGGGEPGDEPPVEDPEAMSLIREDVVTPGTPTWLVLDDSGLIVARRTDESPGEVSVFDHSLGYSTRTLSVAGGHAVKDTAFFTVNDRQGVLIATEGGRLAFMRCEAP